MHLGINGNNVCVCLCITKINKKLKEAMNLKENKKRQEGQAWKEEREDGNDGIKISENFFSKIKLEDKKENKKFIFKRKKNENNVAKIPRLLKAHSNTKHLKQQCPYKGSQQSPRASVW